MRVEGVEPPHLTAPDPKSGASTNSATLALDVLCKNEFNYRIKLLTSKGYYLKI
jgi:hypothetical protein